ncbi:hypothetical protein GW17_00006997 [Ensete ventricosum]|uniref:Uncharacterized protein n=1 Tax=Ensete ventricosum TaxID=4639 RepID=A0A444G0T5_ENSVE|nr:hypothetical protein B296_00028068 [Ensete ventricosum]RWW28516.1 hypothetical protein GW17_00006997 [Ensete ventricosum]
MIVAVAARRLLGRSLSLRPTAAARIGASRPSLRPLPRSRPAATASRFPRSPIETSFCLESLLPMHSATASALMTSMLTISRRGSGWLSEGKLQTLLWLPYANLLVMVVASNSFQRFVYLYLQVNHQLS